MRQRITTLYDFEFNNTIDFETKDDHEFQYQILIPEVTKAFNITKFDAAGGYPSGLAEPIDRNSLIYNYSLRNALNINYTLRGYMIATYKNLKEDVKACIDHIEKELKNK